jgi:prevent-host-death family protein
MATIPQKELRNDVGAVLRRAEAGERITVTVSGRPVAQLGPVEPGAWVDSSSLESLWRTATPTGLAEELAGLADESRDPFAA